MLKLDSLSAGYNGADIIHSISFSVKLGENLCILGRNACGKTTLLKAVAGIIPSTGSVTVDGIEVKKMKRKDAAKKIAFMNQISSVYFSYSVYETVLLGRYAAAEKSFFKDFSARDFAIAEESLRTVDLWKSRDKNITELSGGQLQRVYLARTLAQDSSIILLDEPSNHLDLKNQIELIEFLKNWSKTKQRSVVGVFHDINLALRLADNFLFLKDGRAAAYGKPQGIISSSLLKEIYGTDVLLWMEESLKLLKKV